MTNETHRAARERPRLYLITPPRLVLGDFLPAYESALEGGDVACVQLRLKDAPDAEVLAAAKTLAPLAQERGVAFLLNDRPDLAKACGADGVHVGQKDTPYPEARALLGPEAIIGVTCHASRHLAMEAGEAGADYVAFGAFFPTETKVTEHTADPDILAWWSALFEVPCVAIGGITVDNCGPLLARGADFLAVSGGVWHHAHGPGEAVAAFNREIDRVMADQALQAN